jgi:hypothetical protein
MYQEIAQESWRAVNEVYRECLAETEDGGGVGGHFVSDYDVYLYVFADGRWTIDGAQYIQSTNGCVSAVPISLFNGPAELAEEIEANEDWDVIEEESEEAWCSP